MSKASDGGQGAPTSSSAPGARRFHQSREEYADHLPLVQRVHFDLRDDVEELRAQEGWDEEVWAGVEEWVDDLDSIFRVLRRHRYDEQKTHTALLTSLQQRLSLSLHLPLPSFPPYTDSPLFHILPLPQHTDKLDRPIAVLTVREVVRDEEGSLDDMKEWAWWALEMVRRTLRDYWVRTVWSKSRERKGKGGEGMVLVVDAAGAGYKNMEVELLPTLLSVGHNNFPGMVEVVYVVNAGWTHRSMWSIVKRVLPRSALDKVVFLDTAKSVAEAFELKRLPKAYGGTDPYTFSASHNPIYAYYTHHSSSDSPTRPPSRASSTTSIADIYYSAPNTPARGGRSSSSVSLAGAGWKSGPALRMTKSRDEPYEVEAPTVQVCVPTPRDETTPTTTTSQGEDARTPTRASSRRSSPVGSAAPSKPTSNPASRSASSSALQRIKSLSDFHLYLSPSRLAHLDLLSDSDPDSDPDEAGPYSPPAPGHRGSRGQARQGGPTLEGDQVKVTSPPRRMLLPALFDEPGLTERRVRPPLRLLGAGTGGEAEANVRTYSGRLQAHHASVLQRYTGRAGTGTPSKLGTETVPGGADEARKGDTCDRTILVDMPPRSRSGSTSPDTPGALEPPSLGEHYTSSDTVASESYASHEPSAPIPDVGSGLSSIPGAQAGLGPGQPGAGRSSDVHARYDTSNPWFGYPVVRVPVPDGSRGGTSLRPRYSRNRKRDLVKTLLFLLMLRLQSLRAYVERLMSLAVDRLTGRWFTHAPPIGPSEGLLMSARYPAAQAQAQAQGDRAGSHAGAGVVTHKKWDRDWWWMIIGLLLLRGTGTGTWSELVLAPLEAIGLGREALGW